MNEPGFDPAAVSREAPAQASLLHPANLLTLARLLLSPVLFLLILQAEDTRGASWAAFGLGLALAGTDFFDGRVARRANVVSRSGAFLDPLADKVVVLGAAFCLVAVERYWWVPVTIMAFRELGITAWRARWARRGGLDPGPTLGQVQDLRAGRRPRHGGHALAGERRRGADRGAVGGSGVHTRDRPAVPPRRPGRAGSRPLRQPVVEKRRDSRDG